MGDPGHGGATWLRCGGPDASRLKARCAVPTRERGFGRCRSCPALRAP
ncbi:hypothetical protein BV133_64 [Blastochloris viridis]|uniref:Uncharacterized protein n=1 Tax=Blastochloris viridis TaxID=1079 RepID=A0A182DUU7_BLAVI|nr:hypothetical protein BV133_64 [Blastochloris viridis]